MIKTRRVKDVGELWQQCSLFNVPYTTGATGAETKTEDGTPYVENIWCKWEPLSPTKEQMIGERSNRYETHYYGMLTIPYDKVVYDNEMECLYDGIRYRMVNKIKYRESFFFLECMCIGTKAT